MHKQWSPIAWRQQMLGWAGTTMEKRELDDPVITEDWIAMSVYVYLAALSRWEEFASSTCVLVCGFFGRWVVVSYT